MQADGETRKESRVAHVEGCYDRDGYLTDALERAVATDGGLSRLLSSLGRLWMVLMEDS